MIGIVLITHYGLGESLVQCAVHVLNRRPQQLVQLGVAAQDDPTDLLPLAKRLVDFVDSGQGVLILTDVYGATPSNVAAKLLKPGHVEGLSGVNVPMLIRALTYREKGMDTLLARASSGGRDGILHMKADRDAQS
jgi:PTS system ascorbate-specific IIA component